MTEESTKTLWTENEDPLYLQSFLNKHVQVDILQKQSVSGFVHCIDPVTKSLVLKVLHSELFRTVLIPGCSILKVSLIESTTKIEPKPCESSPKISTEICKKRKLAVKQWLQKNLLPIEEKGEKIKLGEVSILPPYGPNDVCCLNTTVAMDIRRLLMNMPKD